VDLFLVGFGSGGIEDDDLGAGDDVEVDGDKSIFDCHLWYCHL
jgi:hypothetical protein